MRLLLFEFRGCLRRGEDLLWLERGECPSKGPMIKAWWPGWWYQEMLWTFWKQGPVASPWVTGSALERGLGAHPSETQIQRATRSWTWNSRTMSQHRPLYFKSSLHQEVHYSIRELTNARPKQNPILFQGKRKRVKAQPAANSSHIHGYEQIQWSEEKT